jgi:two-component system chemotaxis response regulator CheY
MNRTILTVDDSVTMRQMIIITLAKAGYEVVEASDGVEALAVAAGRKLDLVITDVNMPNMDGITLVRRLRAQPAFKFTPILVLTTEAGQEFKEKGRAAGATGWIVKPFSPDKLLEVVGKVL